MNYLDTTDQLINDESHESDAYPETDENRFFPYWDNDASGNAPLPELNQMIYGTHQPEEELPFNMPRQHFIRFAILLSFEDWRRHYQILNYEDDRVGGDSGNEEQTALKNNEEKVLERRSDRVTDFVASPALMLAWVKGYNVHLEAENKRKLNEETVLASPDYFHELERSIDKIISNYGRLKSYNEKRYHFTFGGKIFPPIESLIADDLFLPPRSAVEFLDILVKDIFQQSVNGAVFYGNWGELLIDENNELSFYLIKRRSKKLSKVLKG